MDDHRRERLKEALLLLLDLPRDERECWIADRLADDPELQREVRSLLAEAEDQPGTDDAWPALVEPQRAPLSAVLPDRIAGYRIESLLGQGGMAVVYRAREPGGLGRTVALKVLKPGSYTARLLERFDAERDVIARLEHPNVAKLIDAGVDEHAMPFLAIELVDGPPLTEYVCVHRLGLQARLRLFVQVCRGVQHAHGRGILHRDIKPSNVLVAERDGRPVPKVIDFGIARLLAPDPDRPRRTLTGELLGTLEYMSPEQADPEGGRADVRSDVYALGVLLYEMLCGVLPRASSSLRGRSAQEVHRLLSTSRPEPPSRRNATASSGKVAQRAIPDVPPEIDCIVLKSLEAEPELRYSSVAEFADDIERHLAGRVVRAHPPTAPYLLWRFARQHRVAVVLALIVAAGIVGSTVATAVGFLRARWQRDVAEALLERLVVERDRSAAALAETREVADFLRDVMLSVHPSRLGPDATFAAVLREAAERLERSPPASSAVHVRTALAVAEPLLEIGEPQRAAALLEPLLPLVRSADQGLGAALRARVRLRLGIATARSGATAGAIELLTEAEAFAAAQGLPELAAEARTALDEFAGPGRSEDPARRR